ncbi:MAG: hypothetical protein V2J07_05555 [Anaerolineae bacterium]|jgi:hypothetical protein|nr:hypothetical protein [Anaerolineae bacterium]
MDFQQSPVAPPWAARIPKESIARIYENDADGLYDEQLINQVAFMLLMRCESMVIAEDARNGRALCPVCGRLINHDAQKGTQLICPYCSWVGSWDAYRASMDGLHLIAPGLIPFLIEYSKHMTDQLSLKEKVFWIDWLIHRVHWEGTALPGQPGAVSLLRGRASDVNEFLRQLNAGTHHESEVELSNLWSEEQKAQIQQWKKAAVKRRVNRQSDSQF